MAEKRRGLGRGLGALISGSPTTDEVAQAEGSPGAGASPFAENPDPGSSSSASSGDWPTPPMEVSRETEARRSTTTVSRETAKNPRSGDTKETAKTLPAPRRVSKTPRSVVKTEDETESDKTAPTPVKQQARKSRPVDMFFAPGRPEDASTNSQGEESGSRRPATGSRNRRVAVPDVLAEVMQQKEDKDTTGTSSGEPFGEKTGTPSPMSVPSPSGASGTSSDVPRETLIAVPGASFAEVPVGDIHPNRKQPRNSFDEEDMAELVHSIREVGLLQPIVVRPSDELGAESYELVMGERRWRAAQAAGLATIPAIIRQTSNTDLLRDALLENLHRSQLNPLEEAAAYQQLMQEFDCTQDELSERIGRSRPQISNTIRLMKLPALVQRRVAAGVLSAGHARALLALADTAEMERVAQRIVNEGLSVRATEEIVAMNDGLRRPAREKAPRATARHERLDYLANSLSDQLDTNVKITLGAKKGRVSIEFGSVDDLNRIMSVISPSSDK